MVVVPAVRRTVQPVQGSCRTSLVQAALYGTCAAHPIGDVTGAEGMHRSLFPHQRNNSARRPCTGGGGTRLGLTWLPSECVGSVLARQLGLGHHTASHSPFSRLAGFVALVAAPTGAQWCPTASCRQGAGEGGQGRVAGGVPLPQQLYPTLSACPRLLLWRSAAAAQHHISGSCACICHSWRWGPGSSSGGLRGGGGSEAYVCLCVCLCP